MARVLIGNDWNEAPRGERQEFAWRTDRLAWFAHDNDILILPRAPEESFLRYVTDHTSIDRRTLSVVVPSKIASGGETLTGNRIADPALANQELGELFIPA